MGQVGYLGCSVMNWRIKRSKLIMSFIFIIAGFSVMTTFFYFVPFSPSDKFTIWLWSVLATSMFAFAMSIILNFNIKKTMAGIVFMLCYSLIFFVPFPLNLGELIWPAGLLLLVLLMWIYKKTQRSKGR
jgi:hypothetical protein